ncbi:hypothetical protein B0P06_003537 [Clostridium saccharoperbutylacetonicum]|uniref:Lipoprotein n=1 Tax=Clostridium saccharoperbutylacetonicum N1-4(HMT) TaxID=931276 RepID=M1MTY0_9CLOT|nr:DUF4883 family protein [Clostridium saccharoperbutylacetonicum]AGF58151.1 hypothetical protein Cspa_c43980 [Clostridium saccharoperbutylacetonicum N1-4(HMT)]NRT61075.1 hypothetical protein [Clostridium saccharoperbutylacetonicum]NSB24390.1 hypothetical protein [Clostridium saccharoperbutylacetonicum]NSB43766.1 hypothetical protein [Clostridium saccharoperbutylacetonicum]
MKKISSIFIILLLSLTLTGCDFQNPRYINFSMKPNNHYYIDKIKNRILNNYKYKLYVFDTNLYKEFQIPDEEDNIVEDFISSINSDAYTDETITSKEPFKLTIIFDNGEKYLIKVFNSSIISVAPWDGFYKEDVISIKDLPLKYNLFDFCNHVLNNPISK